MTAKKHLLFFLSLLPVFVFCSPVQAEKTKDIIKFGTDLVIEEEMNVRDAVVVAGDITVDGSVVRDVVAVGGSVILTNKAVVGRNVVAIGGLIEKGTDAEVGGNLTEVNIPGIYSLVQTFSGGDWTGPFLFFSVWPIISFIGFLALSLLIMAFFPGAVGTVSHNIEGKPVRTGLTGLIGMLLIIPLGILLAVSLIGILLIPVEMVLVSASFLVGYIAVGRLIGNKILSTLKRPESAMIWETFWGIIFLGLIGFIPVVGWLINVLAVLFGFGSVLICSLHFHARPAP
jgi:hypothetical protein